MVWQISEMNQLFQYAIWLSKPFPIKLNHCVLWYFLQREKKTALVNRWLPIIHFSKQFLSFTFLGGCYKVTLFTILSRLILHTFVYKKLIWGGLQLWKYADKTFKSVGLNFAEFGHEKNWWKVLHLLQTSYTTSRCAFNWL